MSLLILLNYNKCSIYSNKVTKMMIITYIGDKDINKRF